MTATVPHSDGSRLQRVDLGEVPYGEAIEAMTTWVEERRFGDAPDRLFLLTHPPVITYGVRTSAADMPPVTTSSGEVVPTVEVDRGGLATYHGPGQLIGYLVVDVKARGPVDIVRWLENGLVAALDRLGLPSRRRDTPSGTPSLVGVWTPSGRKIASIGMRIRRGISSHGFALNIDPDLGVFEQFTACGLHDVEMTSVREIAEEQGRSVPSEAAITEAIAAELGANDNGDR